MINSILILLLLHYVYLFIFKPSKSTLNCGLFGWAGKDVEDFNRDKFDKLGIYNDVRGGHSCGIGMDGEIFIGTKEDKLYKDFVVFNQDVLPSIYPVVIGHTRYATYGQHTMENAHPFGFGENGEHDGFEFIGAHNGTLLNHKELADKNNIKPTYNISSKETSNKIDSEIILEIIYKSKNFKVLSQYNGAAALIFTNVNEPNVVYCYHGKSRVYDFDRIEKEEEERPLFYYKQGKNSLYFSSMELSLYAIGGKSTEIGAFDHNTVYKITDGDIENAEKFVITRNKRFQKGVVCNTTYGKNNAFTNNNSKNKNYEVEEIDWDEIEDPRQLALPLLLSSNQDSNYFNIHNEHEIIDHNSFGRSIYFNKLRYWRNGHLITGCYTWIRTYGFFNLGHTPKESRETFWGYVNKCFHNGYFIDAKDIKGKKDIIIPFINKQGEEIMEPIMYYFYKGIRIKTERDYLACLNQELIGKAFNINALSMCSSHPVVDITNKRDSFSQGIICDGEKFTNIICPLGSNHIYTIDKGNCTDIKELYVPRKPVIIPISKLNEIEDKLIKEEERQKEKEKKRDVINLSEDLLEKDLDEMFMKNYRDFPRYIKRLEPYKAKFEKAVNAINIMEQYIRDSSMLIALEPNE